MMKCKKERGKSEDQVHFSSCVLETSEAIVLFMLVRLKIPKLGWQDGSVG